MYAMIYKQLLGPVGNVMLAGRVVLLITTATTTTTDDSLRREVTSRDL